MIPRSPSEIETDAQKLREFVADGQLTTVQAIRILGAYCEELASLVSRLHSEVAELKARR